MIPEVVNICGIPYAVKVVKDNFTTDAHFGDIKYLEGEIHINKDMPEQLQRQTLVHEWLHGAFVMLGFNDETNNEQLVTALANAINQTFCFKEAQND